MLAMLAAVVAGCGDGSPGSQGPRASKSQPTIDLPYTPSGLLTPTAGSIEGGSIRLIYEGNSSETPTAVVVGKHGEVGVQWENEDYVSTMDIRPWCVDAELEALPSRGVRRAVQRLRAPTRADLRWAASMYDWRLGRPCTAARIEHAMTRRAPAPKAAAMSS